MSGFTQKQAPIITNTYFWPLYTVIKSFLIGLASWALFYSYNIFFKRSGQILIIFLQMVMRYELFAEERYNILSINDLYKKSFICILLKHHYIPHINNLLLILDLFVRPIMTCLWRHYWPHDVLWRLNK